MQATAVRIKARHYLIVVAGMYYLPKHPLKKYKHLEFLGHLGKDSLWGGMNLMLRTPTGALG